MILVMVVFYVGSYLVVRRNSARLTIVGGSRPSQIVYLGVTNKELSILDSSSDASPRVKKRATLVRRIFVPLRWLDHRITGDYLF